MVRTSIWALAALCLGGVQGRLEYRRRADGTTPSPTPVPSCTQTASPIVNGDFESGSLDPWIQGTDPVPSGTPPSSLQIVSGGHNSEHALQMSGGYVAKITQKRLPSCRATNYLVSFDYKVLNVTGDCSIYSTAGQRKYHTVSKSIDNIQVGDWITASYRYASDLTDLYGVSISLVCEHVGASATILMDNIQSVPSGSQAGSGCPKPLGLPNGGFDSGELAPWTVSPPPDENKPAYQVVAPGDNSPHALQLDFPAADFTDWYIEQDFTNLCEGYNYNISWSVNWYNYSGPVPGGPSSAGCSLSVLAAGCVGPPNTGYSYATSTPGWTQYAYTCQADRNNKGYIGVDFTCEGGNIPAWGVQIDSVNLELIGPGPSKKTTNARRNPERDQVAKPRWV